MKMALFGVDGEGGTILSLDDPDVDTDQGAAFTATVVPAEWHLAKGSGMSTMRECSQAVSVTSSATVTLTPATDGVVGPVESFSLASAGEQQCSADFYEQGRRATVTIAVTAHVGITELGDAVQWIVPRRKRS